MVNRRTAPNAQFFCSAMPQAGMAGRFNGGMGYEPAPNGDLFETGTGAP